MLCEFVGRESDVWRRFLADTPHDFYHFPEYVAFSAEDRLCAPEGDGQPLAYYAEDDQGRRLLIVLIVRPIPRSFTGFERLYDATTPYGYASPLVINPTSDPIEPFVAEAIGKFREGLRNRRIVSAFLRSHPVIPFPFDVLRNFGCVVQHGTTVYIDLTLTRDELWSQTRSSHKNKINRCRRNGFEVEIQPDWKDFQEFYRAYTETMERVGASEHYFFPREYFCGAAPNSRQPFALGHLS